MMDDQTEKEQNNQILIVDDSVANLKLLSDILSTSGYQVRQATSGALALQSVKAKLPALILLDVRMPGMDGYEVCRSLKTNPETCTIPVIFISGLDDEQSKVKSFELGGVDFISKPFRAEEILARIKIHIRLFLLHQDLKTKNEKLEEEIVKRKRVELAIESRLIALTQPLDDSSAIDFGELFNVSELQMLQDQFSDAFGVASIITRPDGTPITQPSNFSRLCRNIIRCTPKGRLNCMHSDAVIGRHHPEGPIIQPCLSGGLWDAGASITLGGRHVASWLIGQVRDEVQEECKIEAYAREIGADEADFMQAYHEIPSMAQEQFQKISKVLFTMAGQLSAMAYQNVQQARFISERKRAEAALLENEERFRTTLYSISDGVITTDTEGKVELMNPVAEQLTGWSQSDAAGKSLEEVFPIINEETRNKVEIPVRKVLREGNIVGLANHTLLLAKDGAERPIADSGAPIRNENGETVGVVLVFQDQTDGRRAEQALIETEKRFRLLYENAPLSYQSLDPQARLIDVNPVWLRTMGYSGKDEVIGHHFGEFMTAESAELIKNRFSDFVAAGEIHNYEFDMVRKDGTIITVSYEGKIGYDELGHFKQTHCIFTDITEQKKAELALKESEERFRNIVESSPMGKYFYHLEEDGNLIFTGANPSADKIIGIDHQTLIGKTIQQAFPKLVQNQVPEMYALIAKGEVGTQFFEIEYSENQINGFFQVTVFRIGNNSIAVDFMDISERKQFELKLQRSEQELKKAQQITHIGSWYLNLDNNEVFWSEELYKMYGFDPNLPVPPYTEHRKLFTHESWDLLSTSLANTAETGIPYELELKTVREDGSNGWMWVRGETVKDATGKTIGLWGAAQDISERKKAEHALFESEEMMRNSQSEAHICSYSTNLSENEPGKGAWVCSPEFYILFGIDQTYPHTIEGWAGFIHPDYHEEMVAYHEYVIKERIPFEHEYKIIRINDGAERWVYGTGKLEFNEKGNPIRMHGAIQDITERKQAEKAILEANQKMNSFFEQSLDGFFFMMLDEPIDWINNDVNENLLDFSCSHLKISRVNDAMLDQYGAKLNQIFGKCFLDFFAHDIEQGKDVLKKIFDNGKIKIETSEQKINGENMFIEGDYTCLYDSEGRITGLFGIQRDITESKKITEMLRESENKYRYLFENNPAPMWIYDLETLRFLEVNVEAVNHYGYSRQDFLSMTIIDIHPKEDANRLIQDVQSTYKILNHAGVWRHTKKDGEIIYVDIVSHYIDFEGRPARIIIATDITERIYIQLEIEKEKQLLRTLIDNLPDPIYVKDNEGRKMLANLADLENIGVLDESEVLGKSDLEIFNNEIGYRGYEDDLIVIEKGEPIINKEEKFFDKNGKRRWMLTTKIPILNKSGKTTGLVGIGRDITEQKKAHETIQKLSKGIEQSPSTILITDVFGNIEYVNPKFVEITGYTFEEVVGQNPRILKSGELSPEKYKELWDVISSGGVWRGEFHNRRKNGELYWEWATMTSIKDEYGIITNYIAIKEDISIRKQMEADLIVAKDKAEESDRLKSAFLANMSHEIRTPLNSIIGFSELLADSDFESDQKEEFIRHIITNGNNLLNIISDIMDISKMESKEIKVYIRQINAQKFISNVKNQFAIQFDGKSIDFNINPPAEPDDLVVLADPDRLQQVFNNLISNALKFTSEGFIEIGYETSGKMVQFHVKDTGIGIPAQYHEKIFERFRQVEETSTRKYGGNGLGLAITKNLVDLMGGNIWLESEPGKGSTFYFTLPGIE